MDVAPIATATPIANGLRVKVGFGMLKPPSLLIFQKIWWFWIYGGDAENEFDSICSPLTGFLCTAT
jgi:hypothetical protein